MKQLRIFLFIITALIVLSCSETDNKERITVTGSVLNAAGEKLFFRELDVDSIHDLDSLLLDDQGLFRFTTRTAEPAFYILKFSAGHGIILSLEKGDEPVISADLSDHSFHYVVHGSLGSEILAEFFSGTQRNMSKVDSLRSILMEHRDAPGFYALSLKFDTLFQELTKDQRDLGIRLIEQNPASLASLIILNYQFGMKSVMTPETDLSLFMRLDSTLSAKYPSNRHVSNLHRMISEFLRQKTDMQSPGN